MRTALATGAAVALVAAGLATTSSAGAAPAPVVTSAPVATQKATFDYWTPARMRAARPAPMPAVAAGPERKVSTAATGVPRAVAGQGQPRVNMPAVSAGSSAQPVAFAYPYPFTRFNVSPSTLWRMAPWRVNGKLFFAQAGGNFVCSATSVVAPSRVRVYTAGHCVSNGSGTFNSSALFVPAYNGNSSTLSVQRPYGSFPATSFTTTSAWHNNRDLSRDVGAMRVGLNASGQQLTTAVGSAGFAWNQASDQQFTDHGYPQASPFNGRNLVECQAATARRDTRAGGTGPANIGIGCDMTGGSSGGSWKIRSGGASVGYVNSVNSFKFLSPAEPLAMYGPYLDTLANQVRCAGETPGSLGC